MLTPDFLREQFGAALDYPTYLATGTPEQQRRWNDFHASAGLTADQTQLLAGFTRHMNVLVVSGIWCGDCVQQVPLLDHIARATPHVALRIVDRDAHKGLSSQLRINGGDRVPVVLFMAEDFELCSIFGDRTLHRYRALAAKYLGPACPTGVVPPGPAEVAETMADWVGEFERVQLMLRLSARLRQKHND